MLSTFTAIIRPLKAQAICLNNQPRLIALFNIIKFQTQLKLLQLINNLTRPKKKQQTLPLSLHLQLQLRIARHRIKLRFPAALTRTRQTSCGAAICS